MLVVFTNAVIFRTFGTGYHDRICDIADMILGRSVALAEAEVTEITRGDMGNTVAGSYYLRFIKGVWFRRLLLSTGQQQCRT